MTDPKPANEIPQVALTAAKLLIQSTLDRKQILAIAMAAPMNKLTSTFQPYTLLDKADTGNQFFGTGSGRDSSGDNPKATELLLQALTLVVNEMNAAEKEPF